MHNLLNTQIIKLDTAELVVVINQKEQQIKALQEDVYKAKYELKKRLISDGNLDCLDINSKRTNTILTTDINEVMSRLELM